MQTILGTRLKGKQAVTEEEYTKRDKIFKKQKKRKKKEQKLGTRTCEVRALTKADFYLVT